MSDKVKRFEENEVTTADTFNKRVDEINVALAEIVDSGIGAIPEIKQDITEINQNITEIKQDATDLTAIVAAQGTAATQHATDAVKHITAAEREAWSGKVGKSTSVAATLTAAGWVGSSAPFTQVLSIAAVTATSANEVLRPLALTEAIRDAWDAAAFADGGQSAGKLTVTAWGEKPTINLPCRIIIRGDL